MSTDATATARSAIDAFMARRAEALTLVDGIRDFLDEGYIDAMDADALNWGHVGTIEQWIESLRTIRLADASRP